MSYEKLLSPIKIGNVTLKSHITHSKCYSFMEPTPEEFRKATNFYTAVAKNGAATVTMSVGAFPDCEGKRSVMSRIDMDVPEIQDGFAGIIRAVHQEGTLCSASLMNVEPQDLAISWLPNWDELTLTGDYNPNVKNRPTISAQRIEGMIEDFVYQCKELQRIGFDMVTFYMCYRASILGNALSPVLNIRDDQWGGKTMAERARLPLEVFRRVKEACGQDFLIEIQTSPEEEQPGYKLEDWLEFCKLCDGLVDIFQVRGWDGSNTHVNGFNSKLEAPANLKYAEAFKKAGIKGLVAPVGGFGNPDMAEKFLEEGRTDLISMARGLMVDYDMHQKLVEGRGQDVIPCLFCMKCNSPTCTVNPYQGLLSHPELIPPVSGSKNVAIIGGGPAGMRAAIDCADRGHRVTLFEASDSLGGQLKQAAAPDFKWPVKEYFNWLLRQIGQRSIDVRPNSRVTPEDISGKYDAIILALGSSPKNIPVSGADSAKVWFTDDVYGHEDQLGHRVVVIGGQESGRETALHLAQLGHQVTMVTRNQEHYSENPHCVSAIVKIFNDEENLEIVEFADTTEIAPDHIVCDVKTNMPRRKLTFQYITFLAEAAKKKAHPVEGFLTPAFPQPPQQEHAMPMKASDGKDDPFDESDKEALRMGVAHEKEVIVTLDEKDIIHQVRRIDYDSLVICGGRESRLEEAKAFRNAAPMVYIIGDNLVPGSITECTSSAFAAAIEI